MATCLRHKRVAERDFKPNIQYKCVRSKSKFRRILKFENILVMHLSGVAPKVNKF